MKKREAPTGIFGPDWHKWRGATLRVTLKGEEEQIMRLDEVSRGKGGNYARLTVLNSRGLPEGVREEPWPPEGTVTVVRAP